MFKRGNARLVWGAIASVGLIGGLARAEPRPNILLMCGEDLGNQLNQYGDTPAETPNIDQFASQSLTYEVAWSNAPVCVPARDWQSRLFGSGQDFFRRV
jgi:hypothetical protein